MFPDISFYCYADDSQIYILPKKADAYSTNLLRRCLEDIKVWMALNFSNFNKAKTEVMVFEGTSGSPAVDFGSFAQCSKLLVKIRD